MRGWYSVQTTDIADGTAANDAPPAANDEIPQQLTDALAAGEDSRESAAALDPETGASREATS